MNADNKKKKKISFWVDQNSKAQNIRRLNRYPFFIVLGLILLVSLTLGYVIFTRSSYDEDITKDKSAKVDGNDQPVEAPIHPTKAADADTSSETEQEKTAVASDVSPASEKPVNEEQDQAQSAQQVAQTQIDPAEAKRLEELDAALHAPSKVDAFDNYGKHQEKETAALEPATASSKPESKSEEGKSPLDQEDEYTRTNRQAQKRAFLEEKPDSDVYLAHTKTAPISENEIKAGTVIPGVMISGINSDLPGEIIGQVRENVYDSATGRHILIPAGTRIVGSYDSSVTQGQQRVLVVWQRLIFGDGSFISLGSMPGADTSGFAGFKDKVNNHYRQTFGTALLLSVFSAGIKMTQHDRNDSLPNNNLTAEQTLTQELGRNMGQTGSEIMRKKINIQPTLTIRPGFRFVIVVNKDIVLPPQQ